MNKILKCFLLAIITFFLFVMPVKADKCGEIGTKINNYNEYVAVLSDLTCTDTSNEQTVIQCNDLNLKKNLIVTDLMKLKDEGKICDSKKKDVDKIIKANEDRCSSAISEEFMSLVNTLLTIFYILGPILLIVFGSLDYAKATAAGDEKSFKKANTTFLKRILATVLLILTPIIVNFILSMIGYSSNSNVYVCNYDYVVYNKQYTINAVAKQQNGVSNGGSRTLVTSEYGQAIAEAAKEVKQNAVNNNYRYDCNFKSAEYQGTSSVGHMCCAELLGAALYKSGVLDSKGANEYQTGSAPGLARKLLSKGWIIIENAEDLQPGDAIFYEKLERQSEAGVATINGVSYHICHTEVYYGDGKVINSGDNFKRVVSDFNTNSTCYSVRSRFLVGLRFPGKE